MGADMFQQAALSHCHRATELGNVIAIHMLEYLTTATLPEHGVEELAQDFLDVCRIMWSIEAGLGEFARISREVPAGILHELDRKFQTTHGDFQALDQWLTRSKGSSGKFSKGFRKMFFGNEVGKMRETLGKTREALNMSALIFQWSVGQAKVDESFGIGYTALAAALDRMNGTATIQSSSHGSGPHAASQANMLQISDDIFADFKTPVREPSLRSSSSIGAFPHPPREDSFARPHNQRIDSGWTTESGRLSTSLSDRKTNSTLTGSSAFSRSASSRPGGHPDTVVEDEEGLKSNTLAELECLNLDSETTNEPKTKVIHHSVDPSKMPRWFPRSGGGDTASLRANLVAAILERNSKVVEQLLDRGVSPEFDAPHHPLNEAIRLHDLDIVRSLLLFGASPNAADQRSISPLVACLVEGFLDAASLLVKYGADANLSPGPDHETPFTMSVINGDWDFVRLFLMYGTNVALLTAEGETVLTKGITKKVQKKLIDAILDYGADANSKSADGKTPLFVAITAGRVDIVTSLLDHGANPNLPGPKHMLWPSTYQPACLKVMLARGADWKKSPGIMELATSLNNIESVRILLKAGVNPNVKKDGTYTPLCSSIRDNRPDIFHLLLANGADTNIPAAEYPAFKCITHGRFHFLPHLLAAGVNLNSPKGIAETAVRHNDKEALAWLLDNGVSPNDAAPDTKATPLTTAITTNNPSLLTFLLSRGANPNIRGQDWPVCLAVQQPSILSLLLPKLAQPRAFKGLMEMAVQADQLESIKLLLAAGVSVEDRNGGVFSPLTTALRERNREIVRYLLDEAGADPNAPGEHLPLVKALRRYAAPDTSMIEMLLARGADPNKVYRGHSAVMQTIEMGDAQLLNLLVAKAGVDRDAVDDAGRSPVELAELHGWEEGREIILQSKSAAALFLTFMVGRHKQLLED
ncbi:ankyrin repeat-containing domain protein [Xylariaceae sp. FL0804]|nr:ankyrin repeat-containing domain protein [Xylariaceae sp. FL0804]